MGINMGFTCMNITPELPTTLAGFGIERIAYHVHDDLYMRVMVFEKDKVHYVFYALDTVGIDHLLLDKVTERLKNKGVEKEHILVCASHTHSGHGGLLDVEHGPLNAQEEVFNTIDESYLAYVSDIMEQGYEQALKTKESVQVKICEGLMEGIGKNRNDPTLSGDASLYLWEFTTQSKKRVLLYHFACHPTVFNMQNVEVSADLIGAISNRLSLQYDMSFFINGACGDISTRYTRKGNGEEELERYANIALASITKTLTHPRYEGEFTQLEMKQERIFLKSRTSVSVEAATQEVELAKQTLSEYKDMSKQDLREKASYVEGAKMKLHYALHPPDASAFPLCLSFINIQDHECIGIPGELLSELANPIKQQYGVSFFGYTNGYALYFASKHSYEKQYYEACVSPFAQGQSEVMMQYIEQVLRNRKEENK